MNTPALLLSLGAYLVGAIPFAVIVGKRFDIDPRTAGSRNVGATNVARLMGWKAGVTVLILDISKGALAAFAGLQFDYSWALTAGFCSIFGHCYSIWLRGRGGKGVATSLGVLSIVNPIAAGLALFVWIATAVFFRIAAVSSLLAMGTVVIVCRLNNTSFDLQLFTLVLFILITIRHTSNLRVLKKRWFTKSK